MRISNLNNSIDNRKSLAFGTMNPMKELSKIGKETSKEFKSGTLTIEKANENLKKVSDIKKAVSEGYKIKVPDIFVKIIKWFGQISKKAGGKNADIASTLTKIVLWGNVGKEVVGTILYTVQALTNQDLPQDKRKFVGMYDLAVGVVSTACSFVFGVKLEGIIKKGYKKMMKPMTEYPDKAIKSKAGAAVVGLAAFTSFFLQVIIGKRIIAPAIATPPAGKLKTKLEAKSNGKETFVPQKDALILAQNAQKEQDKKTTAKV